MLDDDQATAIRDALRIFVVGIGCYLSAKVGSAKEIPFLGDLTNAMRSRHTGTRFGALIDWVNMYDVWHFFCMAVFLRLAPVRCAAARARQVS